MRLSTWTDGAGVTVDIVCSGKQPIYRVQVFAPSSLQSRRGIAMGATLNAAREAYGVRSDSDSDSLGGFTIDPTGSGSALQICHDAGNVTGMLLGPEGD